MTIIGPELVAVLHAMAMQGAGQAPEWVFADALKRAAMLAAGQAVDVVFSDFQLLGRLDGWDLHRTVSTDYPDTGFILTSAQSLRQEWQENGVLFVPKPYSHAVVIALINRVIKERNERRDER